MFELIFWRGQRVSRKAQRARVAFPVLDARLLLDFARRPRGENAFARHRVTIEHPTLFTRLLLDFARRPRGEIARR